MKDNDLETIRNGADAVHRENRVVGDQAITTLVCDTWWLLDEVARLRQQLAEAQTTIRAFVKPGGTS